MILASDAGLLTGRVRDQLIGLAKIRPEHFDEYLEHLRTGHYPSEAATMIALDHGLPLGNPDKATCWLWRPGDGYPHN